MKDTIIQNVITGDRATAMMLTDDEVAIIERYRVEKRHAEQVRGATVGVLEIAAAYADWLHKNGAGDTYSTFANDFAWEGRFVMDRPIVHRIAGNLIREARAEVVSVLGETA